MIGGLTRLFLDAQCGQGAIRRDAVGVRDLGLVGLDRERAFYGLVLPLEAGILPDRVAQLAVDPNQRARSDPEVWRPTRSCVKTNAKERASRPN